jgi:adenylate kinase family enzyme
MPAASQCHQRIVVVGTSGSGKTTLARRLAQALDVPHIELDALHWEENWTEAEPAVFRARTEQATRGEIWVLDGNYSKVRDITWARATTVVWLDYSFLLVMWRIITRTLLRTLRHEELWHGNRESFRQGFLSRESVIVWSFTTYHRRRREYPQLFAHPEYRHLYVVRHCSPQATERWLTELVQRPASAHNPNTVMRKA